jgi:hypothetical protein
MNNSTDPALYPFDVIPGWSYIFIILGVLALLIVGVCAIIAAQSAFDLLKPALGFVEKKITKKDRNMDKELLERH